MVGTVRSAQLDWILLRSIRDMTMISYRGFGKSRRQKFLWRMVFTAQLWTEEGNFQDKIEFE